jgi:ElaB/YqjD/DUF883 family membrane-anchored ribosome-binding protein
MTTTDTTTGTAQAAESAEGPFDDVAERLAPKLEEAQEQLLALNERLKAFIKENPGTTLLGAAALGFVIGRLASRK